MILSEAIELAYRFLNDDSLKITTYREFDDKFLFSYELKDGSPLFDNSMIRIDKSSKEISYYPITEHFEKINKVQAIKIDTE